MGVFPDLLAILVKKVQINEYMAIYAIGDIQGCFKTLQHLLKQFDFDPKKDRLLLVGDLINRGPDSLGVLRWAKKFDSSITMVLGNHDLHLIACALGALKKSKYKDLEQILKASDCDEIVAWLRQKPLLYREKKWVMVHAGILPGLSIDTIEKNAQKIGKLIRGNKCCDFLESWYEKPLHIWTDELDKQSKAIVILNSLTRMRVCRTPFEMELAFTGQPKDAPKGSKPWFNFDERKKAEETIIFGHWAALGLMVTPQFIGLDSGCVWGGYLTAIRLKDRKIFSSKIDEVT